MVNTTGCAAHATGVAINTKQIATSDFRDTAVIAVFFNKSPSTPSYRRHYGCGSSLRAGRWMWGKVRTHGLMDLEGRNPNYRQYLTDRC